MSAVKSPEAVMRWCRMAMSDYWYCTEAQVSFLAIERMGVVSHDCLQRARHGRGSWRDEQDGITINTCKVITPIIEAIESGALVFTMKRPGQVIRGLWLDVPTTLPLPQHAIVADANWNYWARCRSCGGCQWLAIRLADRPQVACYRCYPPEQWSSFGALPRVCRLVERMIGEYLVRYDVTKRDLGIIPAAVVTTNSDPYWRKEDRVNRDGRDSNLAVPEPQMHR